MIQILSLRHKVIAVTLTLAEFWMRVARQVARNTPSRGWATVTQVGAPLEGLATVIRSDRRCAFVRPVASEQRFWVKMRTQSP